MQDTQCTYNVRLGHFHVNIVAVGKAINITCCGVVSAALGTQHALRVYHIAICDLPDPIIFFHFISQKLRFWKRKLLNIKCVCFEFMDSFVRGIYHCNKNRARCEHNVCLSVCLSVPVILVRFQQNKHFLGNFF
jgi:hypothetical protein